MDYVGEATAYVCLSQNVQCVMCPADVCADVPDVAHVVLRVRCSRNRGDVFVRYVRRFSRPRNNPETTFRNH